MLILTRRKDEVLQIHVPGRDNPINIMVVKLQPHQVRLGVGADTDIRIVRSELNADSENFVCPGFRLEDSKSE